MRICFFNRSYFPEISSTGQLLTELARDLSGDYGCEVSVVAGRAMLGLNVSHRTRWWKPWASSIEQGVRVYRAWGTSLDPTKLLARIVNYFTYFISSCLCALLMPRCDAVASMTDPPVIGLVALFAARRMNSPYVLISQDVYPEVAQVLLGPSNRIVPFLLGSISRLLVRKADRVVALGATMRDRLVIRKGANAGKINVIPNWTDCQAITPGPKENPFSIAHSLHRSFVVMHSGNVGLSQDLDILVGAADLLRAETGIDFVIIGDGVALRALKTRAETLRLPNLRFLSFQPRESLGESFASADVFVVSLRKGLAGYIVPSKVYGFMAAGRPFIAAVEDECEVAALVRENRCGLLCNPGDPSDLSEKVLELYHHRELSRELGANGRQAAPLFDRKRQVRAYFDMFTALVQNHAKDIP